MDVLEAGGDQGTVKRLDLIFLIWPAFARRLKSTPDPETFEKCRDAPHISIAMLLWLPFVLRYFFQKHRRNTKFYSQRLYFYRII